MDLQNAALLGVLVIMIVDAVKRLVPAVATNDRLLYGTLLAAGQAATWLARYSVWSHEQVVGTRHLDELGAVSLVMVGLFVTAAASVTYKVAKKGATAVASIGENPPPALQPGTPPARAQRVG